MKNSRDALNLVHELRNKKKEHLVCLYLNVRGVLLKKENITIGLVDRSLLHPREIFIPAVESNASSIILIHNHPSGNPEPSPDDFKVGKRMIDAGDLMGIPVVDFLIIAKNGNYSFFENFRSKEDKIDLSYVADGSLRILSDIM